jgi:hypothetical protein
LLRVLIHLSMTAAHSCFLIPLSIDRELLLIFAFFS